MTNVDDKILTRLAKLLEMSGSSNEHEAQVAAQRAAELMAKHQLTAADVASKSGGAVVFTTESGRIDADDRAADSSRVERWHIALASTIATAMGGRMWMYGRGRDKCFMMIGPPDSVSAARYLYASMSKQTNRLARERARELGETQNAWRRAYCIGVVIRVGERLEAGRKQAFDAATSVALVWVDKQKAAVEDEFAKLALRTSRRGTLARPDASSFGYADGNKVDVGGDRASLGEGRKALKS